jgi:hypothetical protein
MMATEATRGTHLTMNGACDKPADGGTHGG